MVLSNIVIIYEGTDHMTRLDRSDTDLIVESHVH